MPGWPRFAKGDFIVVDCETTSLKYWTPEYRLLGFSVATGYGLEPFFIDLRREPRGLDWLKDQWPNVIIGGWHTKIDLHFLAAADEFFLHNRPHGYYCGMVAEALLDEHRLQYSLDSVAKDRLGRGKVEVGDKTRLEELPPEKLAEYATGDADLTYRIIRQQLPELREQELEDVFRLEMDLMPVLFHMEHTGVRVDLEAAERSIPILTDKIDTLQREINIDVGKPFNVNSTPQIRAIFQPEKVSQWQYKLIDGTLCETTKTGGPCIDQHILKEMQHPLAGKIRRLRKLIKTRDTFVRGHVLGHADARGRLHPTINQTKSDNDAGTGSGRMSITDPALQQIPARDKDTAAVIRPLLLPDEDQEWICTDYSQIDFRMAGHLIKDPQIYKAYEEDPDADFHQIVSDMTGIPRNPAYAGAPNAKQLDLGMAFGAGAGKIAKTMGMPYTVSENAGRMWFIPGPEAEKIFSEYHGRFPRIKKFQEEATSIARMRGYVKTFTGRRIRFPNRGTAHKAAGLLYQSYAADLHKIGLINLDRRLQDTGARLIVPVHDEANVSGHREQAELVRSAYIDIDAVQEYAPGFQLRVPVRASLGIGPSWYEATKKD